MTLNINDRVYAEFVYGNQEIPCQWFAKCANPANGLRDGGPLGPVPICKRCDDKMERIANS